MCVCVWSLKSISLTVILKLEGVYDLAEVKVNRNGTVWWVLYAQSESRLINSHKVSPLFLFTIIRGISYRSQRPRFDDQTMACLLKWSFYREICHHYRVASDDVINFLQWKRWKCIFQSGLFPVHNFTNTDHPVPLSRGLVGNSCWAGAIVTENI